MKNAVLFVFVISILESCNHKPVEETIKKSHPSHKYHYVKLNKNDIKYIETLYLPIYSDIYYTNGTLRYRLTATVSIRNISQADTAYLLKATYYDSYGKILKEFADSSIMLLPMESFEFVVEESEKEGGAGANFIVEWGALKNANQLIVQSVMIGTGGQQGISFLSEARVIKQEILE
jgi:hypothetical protein